MKNLELQNRCLLMKFIDKLFSSEPASWKDWILREVSVFDAPVNGAHSYLWKIVNES